MKLLSLWEPWATLMAIGAKRIETRSWQTPVSRMVGYTREQGRIGDKASQGLCDVSLETLTEIRRQWKESKR